MRAVVLSEPGPIENLEETLQTAYGSLTVGLDLRAGQSLLIRGGTRICRGACG
jgi:hypothetical protein